MEHTVSYEKIIELKYREGVSTNALMKQFPKETELVSEVALLDLPEDMLREIIHKESTLNRLIRLKRKFLD